MKVGEEPERARLGELFIDYAFVLWLPLYAAYEFVALHRPWLPILAGAECIPLAWIAWRRSDFRMLGVTGRSAWVALVLLVFSLAASFSLPALLGELPEVIRYEASIDLGALGLGVPFRSLALGALTLGVARVGGDRLALRLARSENEKLRLGDLYFCFTALLANLAIVRYAGGPFFE
ncbi:MAG: hypothetical protein QM793_14675 [Muricomes sp.]